MDILKLKEITFPMIEKINEPNSVQFVVISNT